jgi:2-polyprenyl-3-methyl-5-hydroxy-6-metoxy-1,4-benzoquinol methylase
LSLEAVTSTYLEFEWHDGGPANGESGAGLADKLVALVREMNDVKTICDLGCGNGYLASRLATFGYDIFGIDASASGVEIARTKFKPAQSKGEVTFLQSAIDQETRSRTGISQVDLVISSDVIEHLYRPADLLEAAEPLLRPQGQIVITTPYHGYLKNVALSLSGKMDNHFSALHDGGHIKFFSVKTLSELVARYSFTNLSFSYYGRAPWLWKNMICKARRTG